MEVLSLTHVYDVSLNWNANAYDGTVQSGSRFPLHFGPPPEFGGPENLWSPEHLLAASVATCYTTTFMHFAKLLNVKVSRFTITCVTEFKKQTIGFEATHYLLRPVAELKNDPGQ